ncbi:MAG TPA: class IV adenylate cyclase [Candidatus Acidoferrales bacterium]|nr:class IV adenylate cyclase [Candidatus Acidoferrales bacterium]
MPQSKAAAVAPKPAHEVEVKLRVADLAAIKRKLGKLGAKSVQRAASGKDGRVHEMNTLFDTPQGGLARHGQLVRIRVESPAGSAKGERSAVLTYKGPAEANGGQASGLGPGKYKVREEIEAGVGDAESLRRILEALGLRGWFKYEKYRTTFTLPTTKKWAAGLLIELDETPIGSFIELEGPPAAIDQAARELGYSHSDYITKNYLLLHIEQCQRDGRMASRPAPGAVAGIPNMLFQTEKKSS